MAQQILIDFGTSNDAEIVVDGLRDYASLLGISQKRLFLLGVADYIAKQGDNPELVLKIVEYLQIDRRKKAYK